jgi:hypothetical protein
MPHQLGKKKQRTVYFYTILHMQPNAPV